VESGHSWPLLEVSLLTRFDISAGSFAMPHNDRFGGLEIDSQFEFYRLLDRLNGGFRPVEDFVHVEPDLMKQSRQGNDERSATYIDRDRAGLRLQRLE
jgi:hypothetical protein